MNRPPRPDAGITKHTTMRKIWTEQEKEALRELYPDTRTDKLAEMFNCKLYQMYGVARRLGLKKSEAYLASPDASRLRRDSSCGIQHRFKPGHTSWNKGLKGINTGGEATRFRPGQMPHNHVPVGTVVKDSEGYLKIKLAEPRTWKYLHRKNWEDVHGPTPKEMVLVFKDRNSENCDIENLELLTRKQNMLRNSVHNYPEEIKEVIRIRASLVRKINRKEKKQ
jgi:hypothetical protein